MALIMRLYLSSFGLGDQPEQLVDLANPGNRAAIILNALDNRQDARDRFLASQTNDLNKLGFITDEIDLRAFFGKQKELEKILQEKDMVWINGGNAFLLRRAMKQSGFDIAIKKGLEKDSLVYAGFSAGVVVLAPDLHGLEIIDDPIEVSSGYDPKTIWDGLGIIKFAVAVHYDSNHPESQLVAKEIEYFESNNIPYKKLRDGEVIIIDEVP
jgi:dipeptidase E